MSDHGSFGVFFFIQCMFVRCRLRHRLFFILNVSTICLHQKGDSSIIIQECIYIWAHSMLLSVHWISRPGFMDRLWYLWCHGESWDWRWAIFWTELRRWKFTSAPVTEVFLSFMQSIGLGLGPEFVDNFTADWINEVNSQKTMVCEYLHPACSFLEFSPGYRTDYLCQVRISLREVCWCGGWHLHVHMSYRSRYIQSKKYGKVCESIMLSPSPLFLDV